MNKEDEDEKKGYGRGDEHFGLREKKKEKKEIKLLKKKKKL